MGVKNKCLRTLTIDPGRHFDVFDERLDKAVKAFDGQNRNANAHIMKWKKRKYIRLEIDTSGLRARVGDQLVHQVETALIAHLTDSFLTLPMRHYLSRQ